MNYWVAVVVCMMLMPSLARAESMQVDADTFTFFQDEKKAVFQGNVLAKRGDLQIKADKMTLWYTQQMDGDSKRLKSAKAAGNVHIVMPDNQAAADVVSFDAASEVLVLKGQASMTNEQGTISGEHITHHLRTKDTKVLQGKEEKQVRFIFDE